MEIWKLLLITLLSSVVLGCIVGVVSGKHQLKVKRPDYKPLLTVRERLAYTGCMLLGACCIAGGVYLAQREPAAPEGGDFLADGGMFMEEMPVGGAVIGGAVIDEAVNGNEIVDDKSADSEVVGGNMDITSFEENAEPYVPSASDGGQAGEASGEAESEAEVEQPDDEVVLSLG